ncbi:MULTISPECIES: hypothetical protein [Pseudonocardia]|uniref:Uncharacterized protein n=2 Tax=Pseudonocardia TaxID=1847 RepID=A0A1Y2MM58_PSEAH|nr:MULTISPECIES: hypothetical protein [Pseudonocardia]OSY36079.1 hypothetical protein BG845_05594 [Pseudonocardia autotrophica]TDN77560.1 hypothetical protein C8E95_6809 [Pseudonocardia autotrophica]BBG01590.1 hypothetical protein Pdca_27990 [Pseudonocardia autotrophica]GEC25335.1 hypothetical protein PSA01_23640 [Pseudonocardia saturnea]
MSAVFADDNTRAGLALGKLNELGSPDHIANHLHEHGVVGDHHAETCPIANHIRRETRLNVSVTHLAWRIADNSSTFGWHLPEHVAAFILAFDEGRYPDLVTKDD